MAEIDLDININGKAAAKSLDKFRKSAKKSFDSVEGSLKSLNRLALGFAGIVAGRKIVQGLSAVTDAAAVQEDAIKQLNTALALAGDFSEEASQGLQKFASDLQDATNIGDETTISLLALAKSFDVSNERAQDLVTAAADLSAQTGIELESAVRNLGKSLSGLSGELGESVSGIRELTEEELKAGGAIDLVADRFRGAAAAAAQTYSGAVDGLTGRFADFTEEIGFLITQNPVVIELLNQMADSFKSLGGFIKDNADDIRSGLNKALLGVAKTAPAAVRALGGLAEGIIQVISGFNSLDGIASQTMLDILDSTGFVADGFKLLLNPVNAIITGFAGLKKSLKGLQLDAAKANAVDLQKEMIDLKKALNENSKAVPIEEYRALEEQLQNAQDEVADLTQEVETLDKVGQLAAIEINVDNSALKEKLQARVDAAVETKIELEGVSKKIQEIAGDLEKGAENAVKDLEEANKKQGKSSDNAVKNAEKIENLFGLSNESVEKINTAFKGIAGALGTNILGGAEGAKKAVAGIGGAITEAIAPGFGGAAASFIETMIELGPEGARAQIEAFVEQLPVVIQRLAETIPVVAQVLAEEADVIAVALGRAMPIVAVELSKQAPFIAIALAESLVQYIGQTITDLADAFKFIGAKVSEGIQEVIDFGPPMKEAANEFQKDLKAGIDEAFSRVYAGLNLVFEDIRALFDNIGGDLGDVGGGGQGLVPDSVPVLGGLATGGVVGGTGVGDSQLFALEPGELVVDKGTTSAVQDFFAGGGSSTMELILAQILEALKQPMNVTTTAEVDGEAFARVNLELDRLNERTSVA